MISEKPLKVSWNNLEQGVIKGIGDISIQSQENLIFPFQFGGLVYNIRVFIVKGKSILCLPIALRIKGGFYNTHSKRQ